jgi:hypothetical protein
VGNYWDDVIIPEWTTSRREYAGLVLTKVESFNWLHLDAQSLFGSGVN